MAIHSPPALVWNTQKLDAVVDGKLPDDLDSASILIKVIGHKLSDGSCSDLYLRFRMNFAADVVQTQTPTFMDMGFSTINVLDESSVLSTLVTRIRRATYGSHCCALDDVFGEATAVGIISEKSDRDYTYKTEFKT